MQGTKLKRVVKGAGGVVMAWRCIPRKRKRPLRRSQSQHLRATARLTLCPCTRGGGACTAQFRCPSALPLSNHVASDSMSRLEALVPQITAVSYPRSPAVVALAVWNIGQPHFARGANAND